MPSQPTATMKRQPRLRREELRSLMLEAGRAILFEDGLGLSAESLTFKKVFDRVEAETGIRITNASVIGRVWSGQDAYRVDVVDRLATTMAGEDGSLLDTEYEAVFISVAVALEGLDLTDPDDRAFGLQEIARRSTRVGSGAMEESRWVFRTVAWMMTVFGVSGQKDVDVLQHTMGTAYTRSLERFRELNSTLMTLLGLRMQPGLSIDDFTRAQMAFLEGFQLRQAIEGPLPDVILPTGHDGSDEEWSMAAIGVQALAQRYFEVDPEHSW